MMRKGEIGNKWDEEGIRQYLQEEAGKEAIPDSLRPGKMEEWLRERCSKEQEGLIRISSEPGEDKSRKGSRAGRWCGVLASAACLAFVLFAVGRNMDWRISSDEGEALDAEYGAEPDGSQSGDAAISNEKSSDEAGRSGFEEGTTYAELYKSFDRYWTKEEELYRNAVKEEAVGEGVEESAAEMEGAADSAGAIDTGAPVDMDSSESSGQEAGAGEDYGKTNQQEESVEEADIVKNDGRYLYRAAEQRGGKYGVRITDTKGGLKEAAQVGNFDDIQEIYVWKDKLAVIETGWAAGAEEGSSEMGADGDASEAVWESGYSYSRIHMYDISDRTNPHEYHTFTIKGSYMDSRIFDGYLYFFTFCDTSRPKEEEDLRTYVPMLDGKPIAEDKITFPEGSEAASYLVMASVDMEHPDKFTDTRALVASADRFYVSQSSIYVADTQNVPYEEEGRQSDSTVLYRYSYKKGKMHKEAKGEVEGTLRDDMAMNEYQGCLRMVTTVESQNNTKIVDDITGEFLGYDDTDYQMTNSLYVLDSELNIVGKIENLAEDERVYSARFMGNTGYFVTFRETDPLFSVDLSNPREPKILGELKISGFSEYLHFYADNLLLGIGMEADENTGATEGMKLSMFDISNPADVKEKSKAELPEYGYSEALYNYKAVLIDTEKNIFGFSAEDYENDRCVYLLFTFEDGMFRKILEIDCSENARYGYGYGVRGTYIGERFFLLPENGLVEEYSLTDGSKTAVLEP